MNKEEMMEYIDEDLVEKAQFFDSSHLPPEISNAMYLYGSNEDYNIAAFIKANDDGSQGMIITEKGVYFDFKNADKIFYGDIVELSLVYNEESQRFFSKIKTTSKTFVFKNNYLNLENFIKALAYITDKKIHFEMDPYKIVHYFVPLILKDMEEENYEDLELTDLHHTQIKDIYHELESIQKLEGVNFQDETRSLCRYCLDFFECFGLDSEEIDALNQAQDFFDEKSSQEDIQLENAKKWFDQMNENYQKGDTAMYDQLKQTMDSLGIDEEAIKNMTPEEVDQYVKDICDRFGVSPSLFEKLKDRFGR